MGVKTNVAAISPIAASFTQAETLGIDVKGLLASIQLKCQEATQMLNVLATDVATPASDSTFSTAISTAITALS
jgi:hypothetical protein